MKHLGSIELTTIELPQALEFVAVRESHAIEWIWVILAGPVLIWFFFLTHVLLIRAFAVLAGVSTAAGAIASWLQGRETMLRVSADELIARGNLGRFFTTEIQIPVSDIQSLRWDSGGDGGASGLYAERGWSMTLVLPHISREQAESIRDQIAERFPEFPLENNRAGLSLFSGDELTTLGLSKPPHKDSKSSS